MTNWKRYAILKRRSYLLMELMATEVYVQHQYSLILGYIFLIKRKTKLHSHPQWLEGALLKARPLWRTFNFRQRLNQMWRRGFGKKWCSGYPIYLESLGATRKRIVLWRLEWTRRVSWMMPSSRSISSNTSLCSNQIRGAWRENGSSSRLIADQGGWKKHSLPVYETWGSFLSWSAKHDGCDTRYQQELQTFQDSTPYQPELCCAVEDVQKVSLSL